MPKPKRLYHSGAIVPNDYDFEKDERVLLMVCIPKSPLWIAMYKGLLSMPTNYWFWRLDSTIAHNSVKLAKDVFYNGVFMTCFNELNYNLQEMNFTLKRIENNLSNNKTIATFGQQPTIARLEDGTIDTTTNNSVTNSSVSVFEFGSLLETNNISEVLAIALLDDSTIQLPDLNPFNLESKLDDIRTDINETKIHFTNDFTDLMNYFASSFREGTWSPLSILNNPFSNQSIYQMLLDTFNDTQKTYATVYIPFWGNTSLPVWTKNHSLIDKFNQNFSNTFNEQFNENTDLASNSYFRGLHYWLTTDWKLFEDIMGTMRDCICLANDFLEQISLALWGDDNTNGLTHIKTSLNTMNSTIAGLDITPTVNVNACCDDTTDSITNIGDTITNLGDTITNLVNNVNNSINHIGDILNDNSVTTTVTDNGDNTYTIVNNEGDTIQYVQSPVAEIEYPPIDVDNPELGTTKPLKPVTVIERNGKNALCGFTYFMFDGFATFLEYLFGLLNLFKGLTYIMSSYKASKAVIESAELINAIAPNGMILAKLGTSRLMSIISGYWLIQLGADVIPATIRGIGEEFACGLNGKAPIATKHDFINNIIQTSITISPQSEFINYIGYLAGIFWDYSNASDSVSAIIDMNDYVQYCPCPITGEWEGQFYRQSDEQTWTLWLTSEFTFEGEREWGLTGNHYHATISGVIDQNNPLLATIHHIEDYHEGFPAHYAEYDSNAAMQNNNTELNNNNSIFVRI